MFGLTDKILAIVAGIGCIVLAGLLLIQTGRLHTAQLATAKVEKQLLKEQRDRETERVQLAQAYSKAVEDVLAQQKIVNTQYQEALNEARKQTAVALRHERDARAESDGLREQAADADRRIADLATPPSAVREYAATVNGLFDQCQRDYQDMAAKAQGHSNDVATLIAAWPRVASMADSKPSQPE